MEGGTYMSDRPEFKVYKLYRDSLEGNPNSDYINWPDYQGAPVDQFGRPIMQGDQMLWTVYNDADPWAHNNRSGETDPLGIEVQQTFWAVDEPGEDTIALPLDIDVEQLGTAPVSVQVLAIDADSITGDQYIVEIFRHPEMGSVWQLKNVTTGVVLLENRTDFMGGSSSVVEGIIVKVFADSQGEWEYESAFPPNISPVAEMEHPEYTGGRWFTGGNHGGQLLFGGIFLEPYFWGGTTLSPDEYKPVELRYRPMVSYTDLTGNGIYDIGEPYWVDDNMMTQKAFMYYSFFGDAYEGFFDIPFTAWDISDPYMPRQLNVVIRDRDANLQWDLNNQSFNPMLPNGGDQRFNYVWILDNDYDPTGTYYGDGTGGSLDFFGANGGNSAYDAMWVAWLDERNNNGGMLAEEGVLRLTPGEIYTETITDTFSFVSEPPQYTTTGADGLSIYFKYKLYNEGGNNIEDMYITFWSDPDLGGAGDDLSGCDSLGGLFYCYNGYDYDEDYNYTIPAIGFKVIHGPLVPSVNDTAVFDANIVPGYKNLGLSTFSKCINGTDPLNFTETYNYMQGLSRDGSPYMYDGNILKYMHSGDPVADTGDVDYAPADRRLIATCGPITMNAGDSQYVMVKMAVGQGSDRLESISKVKEILNRESEQIAIMASKIIPDPQYAMFLHGYEPIMDTLIIGWTGGAPPYDINPDGIVINSSITPVSTETLAEYSGYTGPVVRAIFPAANFINMYGLLWDASEHVYTVTGFLMNGEPFNLAGLVTMVGHISGDVNADGVVNLMDMTYLIDYLYRNGAELKPCLEVGDVNSSGSVNIQDVTYLVGYLYRSGPAPSCPAIPFD